MLHNNSILFINSSIFNTFFTEAFNSLVYFTYFRGNVFYVVLCFMLLFLLRNIFPTSGGGWEKDSRDSKGYTPVTPSKERKPLKREEGKKP